ncbi:MAG: hypothetical protein JOZ75_02340, partial [Candidatus Dormibacteraeota bacterium]|nr:hypothetical protein [Candidatus Dormibacteraeota bacterium]
MDAGAALQLSPSSFADARAALRELLDELFEMDASDLILSRGAPPTMRIDGKLLAQGDIALTAGDIQALALELLLPQQWRTYEELKQVDFSFKWGSTGRIRGNMFQQRGSAAIALRAI